MSKKDKVKENKPKNSNAIYENFGETFADKVQNLANHLKDLDDEMLNEPLDMVIGAVPSSRTRDLKIEAEKAEIEELRKQRDDYKERAYIMADQRPLIQDFKGLTAVHTERDETLEEERKREAEEKRKAEAAEFLGGL